MSLTGEGGEHYRSGWADISTKQPPHIPHPSGTGLRILKPLPPVFAESCLETGHSELRVGELLKSGSLRTSSCSHCHASSKFWV